MGGAGGSENTSTATTLANDQATIDTAEVSLLAARAALEGAVITAPFSGRVGTVDVVRAGRVTAGTTAVVVVSKTVTNVKASATEEQVTSLANGQKATVLMPGSNKGLTGTVTAISRLPETSTSTTGLSTSSTGYPVHVVVDNVGTAMPVGSQTSVSVVVGRSPRAVTVPTSAVTLTTSTTGTVRVIDDGRAVRKSVTVGEVGSARTAITAGLTKGTEIVLADVDQAVPTGDSTTPGGGRLGGGAGGGRLGGGGSGGGSFGGGAPPAGLG